MYLARELTEASLPQIGDRFGGRHHTTVIYAVNKIERQLKDGHDRQLHELVQVITRQGQGCAAEARAARRRIGSAPPRRGTLWTTPVQTWWTGHSQRPTAKGLCFRHAADRRGGAARFCTHRPQSSCTGRRRIRCRQELAASPHRPQTL